MTVKRMDNIGIVVEDIDTAVEFFTELGLMLEGRAPITGNWADGVTGLRDMRVELGLRKSSGSRLPAQKSSARHN
jgi:catechol 2,3-dioxygenase-like lactoylglutathione lyase family enzyme